MAADKQYLQGLDEYIRQEEPQEQERSRAWQTAIGLQEVDGLKTSPYLLETARKHIEGDITISEAKQLIDSYYRSQTGRKEVEAKSAKDDSQSANSALRNDDSVLSLLPKCKNSYQHSSLL